MQKEIIKQINVVRKRLKLKPLEEDVRKMPARRCSMQINLKIKKSQHTRKRIKESL